MLFAEDNFVRRCHQNGSVIQKSTGARRLLLDNRCNMALRELIGPADLTRAFFCSLLYSAFNWEPQQ